MHPPLPDRLSKPFFTYWLEYFLLKGFLVEGKYLNTLAKTIYPKEQHKHRPSTHYY